MGRRWWALSGIAIAWFLGLGSVVAVAQSCCIRVLDAATGAPIAGAWLEGPGGSLGKLGGMTDASGHWQGSGAGCTTAGHWTVQALGYRTERFAFSSEDGDCQEWKLAPLRFMLPEAGVEAVGHGPGTAPGSVVLQETAATAGARGILTSTPGWTLYDAGAGILQPVLRGWVGSRVTWNAGGMPLEGSRWGADHGLMFDPLLWDEVQWVQGSEALWEGPGNAAGVLRTRDDGLLPQGMSEWRAVTSYRVGDGTARWAMRQRTRGTRNQWTWGGFAVGAADRNVPATQFLYLGRWLPVAGGRLVNTSGHSGQLQASLHRDGARGGTQFYRLEAGGGRQGLFPGVVGVPTVGDLAGDDDSRRLEWPQATTLRWQASARFRTAEHRREWLLGVQRQQRREWAPPHAHGFGPLPDSGLALGLLETVAMAAVQWNQPHSRWGVQLHALNGDSEGWEFLMPDHRMLRLAAIATGHKGNQHWGVRLEAVGMEQDGHSEPLFGPGGALLGTDVRSRSARRFRGGVTLRWGRSGIGSTGGGWRWETAWVHRIPDPFEWAAHGIHHGTFRFEQGNPNLRTEYGWVNSGRWQWSRGERLPDRLPQQRWFFNGSLDVHTGTFWNYIYLAPTARFAPLAHAGQIHSFQQAPVARLGMEWSAQGGLHFARGASMFLRWQGMALGAWVLTDGTGLPLVPPLQGEACWGVRSVRSPGTAGWEAGLTFHHRSPAWIRARNEPATPGSWQGGAYLALGSGTPWRWALRLTHATGTPYLDHASIYRALQLPAQGRLLEIECRWTPAATPLKKQRLVPDQTSTP